jgi:hypothetical protein
MNRLFFAAVLILSVASGALCAVATGGTDDYSSGAEVMYPQPESREVYGSGAIQKWIAATPTEWAVVATDPISGANTNGALVMVYRLPERGDKLIEARSLMFKLKYIYSNRLERVDLYGIGYSAAAQVEDPNLLVTGDMFYIGAWGADPQATALDQGMAVQADVGVGGSVDIWFANSAEGALRLSCWLNSLYDAGAVAGDYVLIRLNYSLKYSTYTNFKIHNNTTADGPRIYYDFVDNLSETCPGPVIPAKQCVGSTAGDLTGDCIIDLSDFVELANDWLRCERIPSRMCD